MAGILPPDLSTTFLIAAVVPLIIGFIVGVIIRSAVKIGLALAVLVFLLIALGMITPNQVLTPILGMVKSSGSLSSYVTRVSDYLPYSSITFIVGLAVGLLKG